MQKTKRSVKFVLRKLNQKMKKICNYGLDAVILKDVANGIMSYA